jgi:hypothetical protein
MRHAVADGLADVVPAAAPKIPETRDEASLPRGLDRVPMVVAAYIVDGVSGRDTIQDGKTRQRGSGATASAATSHLDPLRRRALPGLEQRLPSVICVCRQPPVTPADPTRRPPRSRQWLGEQVHAELRLSTKRHRRAQRAATQNPPRRQGENSRLAELPTRHPSGNYPRRARWVRGQRLARVLGVARLGA